MSEPDPVSTAALLPPPMPPRWCVLELLGHRRLVGRVSEVELFGRRMGLIEVPNRAGGFEAQYFGGASVYALTETTEERVRAELARRWADEARWALPAHAEPDDDQDDDHDQEYDADDEIELGARTPEDDATDEPL